jgi:hypothetical protein
MSSMQKPADCVIASTEQVWRRGNDQSVSMLRMRKKVAELSRTQRVGCCVRTKEDEIASANASAAIRCSCLVATVDRKNDRGCRGCRWSAVVKKIFLATCRQLEGYNFLFKSNVRQTI